MNEDMNREDELIREALKLDIAAPDELNSRILRAAGRKRRGSGFWRTAAAAAVCLITILGTGIIVDASTGGRIIEYLRGKSDNRTYVYGNGSDTETDDITGDGEEWEQVEYITDNVVMAHPVSEDTTEYCLYLKLKDVNGTDEFISLSASVKKGQTTEDLYYAIRGEFLRTITQFRDADAKQQILSGLSAAAANADMEAVRDALLDLSSDYEENRRIFYTNLPGKWWGTDGNIVIFEDITDLPAGEAAIIADTVDGGDKSWIFVLQTDEAATYIDTYGRGDVYSEKYYRELIGSGIPVYDLR